MMDDLQARLDRAITEARRQAMLSIHKCWNECAELEDASAYHRHEPCDAALDRYAALVALRARYDECDQFCDALLHVDRVAELTAEAELRLGGRMTDEQRPWREWPEWKAVQQTAWDDMTAEVDALCARVWREAQADDYALKRARAALALARQAEA